jgi:hypothetical protein
MRLFSRFSKEKIRQAKRRFLEWTEDVFSDKKKTFRVLALFAFSVLFLVQITIIIFSNGFFNGGSDDVCQYYPIVNNFFNQIKNGTLSWFNLSNYFGASFFSDAYYVAIDGFTLIAFLLSYIMPFAVAFSSTELLKLFAGVMILGYFLHLSGYKNRTIFWMSVIYMVSGGMACFTAFPSFYSMVFYLPMSLVIIRWFQSKKAWVVPIFVFALVLYNFYSAFMVLAFMSGMYIVESLKKTPFRFGKFLVDGMAFLGLILLGVAMSAVYFIPTVQFILEDTYRGTGDFNGWIVNIGSWELELFKPEVYIRILAKTFTEQRAAGFVGFLDDYRYEHVSLYITVVGLTLMSYVFFMKDKISWIYKGVIVASLVMMFFPFFSYVLSGTQYIVDVPYTRWIDMLPLVEILILAHVIDQKGIQGIKMKWLTIPIVLFMAIVGFVLYYYIERIESGSLGRGKDALTVEAYFLGAAGLYLILILVFGWFKRLKWVLWIFAFEFVTGIGYIYAVSYALVNRIDYFDDMESINVFLNEHLEQDEFYRVYVDVTRFNVLPENFNRMTTFWTNTQKIFHSWSDAETNRISAILFDRDEYQEKYSMMAYNMYLDHMLGYKYMLVNSTYEYNLPEEYYTLVAEEGIYRLYEIAKAEPFQVYESYLGYVRFDIEGTPATTSQYLSQQKLIDNVLLDLEAEGFVLPNLAHGQYINSGSLSNKTIYASSETGTPSIVETAGVKNDTVREFFRYSAADLSLGYDSGGVWFQFSANNAYKNAEVFMETSNRGRESCEITVIGTTTMDVKCPQFWGTPEYFYFEKNDYFSTARKIEYRKERAINGASYLVYDLPANATSNAGMMFLSFTKPLDRAFLSDAEDHQYPFISGNCYYQTKPVRLYILKTYEMDQVDEFDLRATIFTDDLSYFDSKADSPLSENERMTIEKGRITLSYTRTSDSAYDQVVMIPVTYSEEWVITSAEKYSIMSVSGGFIGIVIPHGTNEVSITMRFIPKGLKTGAWISLGAAALYVGIFSTVHLLSRRKKEEQTHSQSEVTNHDQETDSHRSVL